LAFARRDPGAERTHVVDIVGSIAPPERPTAAWIEETTRRIAAELESFVRREPSRWLWLHRRWKSVERRSTTQRAVASRGVRRDRPMVHPQGARGASS